MTPPVIQRWIDMVESRRTDELDTLLARLTVVEGKGVGAKWPGPAPGRRGPPRPGLLELLDEALGAG